MTPKSATATLAAGLVAVTLASTPAHASQIRHDQWHLRYLNVAKAHQLSQGQGVVVAVPDTGVDPHPDLRNNLLQGTDTIGGGPGDGRQDRDGHGTGMAGLIAAHGTGEGSGALGIAPKASIIPIYETPPKSVGSADALAGAIEYALTKDVDVICIASVGGSSVRLQRSVEAALQANVIVVAGVGNHPREYAVGYPARHPGVIAVGGVDRNGDHAAVSVIGPEVDVVAPATDIVSTSVDGRYRKGTGTSDATAIVAGAAALIRAKFPFLPVAEVEHRLTATAVDKGPPGRDDKYGYGVIDLVAALTADVPPLGFASVDASPPARSSGPASTAVGPTAEGGTSRRWLVGLGALCAVTGVAVWALAASRRRRAAGVPPNAGR